MENKTYFKSVIKRTNIWKEKFLTFFLILTMPCRIALEVFIRKDFGERYFSMFQCWLTAIILSVIPLIKSGALMMLTNYHYYNNDLSSILANHLVWYVFIFLFMRAAYKRKSEIKRNPGVYDFAKFTLNQGKIDYRLFNAFGREWDVRQVEIYIEPLVCFICGIVLYIFSSTLGLFIIICSLCYSLGYYTQYYIGDQYFLDEIDKLICKKDLAKAYVDNKESSSGFSVRARRPSNPELARELVDSMSDINSYEESTVE